MLSESDVVRWRVPWFDGRTSFRDAWPAVEARINQVFDHDKFVNGQVTAELGQAIASYTGARYAVGVNSGADALYLVLRAVGVGEGDEVVMSDGAEWSSVAAVERAGATPVFTAKLSGRTRAVLAAHSYGRMPDLGALRKIAADAGVPLVEDGVPLGSRHDGVHAGLSGAAGAVSFAPDSTLGALGDAGMVITGDRELATRCMMLRHHGRTSEVPGSAPDTSGPAAMVGVNSKMDEIQAAVLLARLDGLDGALARRREVAARYTSRLTGIDGLGLPAQDVWPAYVVAADRRDDLAEHLTRAGVQTVIPRAATSLALPVHPDLSPGQIDHVCDAISRFYRGGRA
ncbi:DegT/DnrJ/EryC1/StrS family aminotransferase [Lentzea sp. NPDC006480]|uniref:DegT/DnrJ/EryC1/StrS family aminotransferase n=1 Tax=Lentzea sp. NPDC006480 TaxID=3157176 RepID=UPI0033B6B455